MRTLVSCLFLALAITGCGSSTDVKVSGTLLKNGQPYPFEPEEMVQITFRAEQGDYLTVSTVNAKTGAFDVTGQTGTGIPRGPYKISLVSVIGSAAQDRFDGAFADANSLKFTFAGASEKIAIDVGAKTVTKR